MQPTQQARAPETQPFGAEAFGPTDRTVLRWLGMAGFLINSRGTTIMVDPLLGGFDMPIMIEMPIAPKDVPHLDAILVTHSDNDHYSVPTCRDLAAVTRAFHSTRYVASLMRASGRPRPCHRRHVPGRTGASRGHPGRPRVAERVPGASNRVFHAEDACGFWITTPDGTIWAPGDSRLIPDHHLRSLLPTR